MQGTRRHHLTRTNRELGRRRHVRSIGGPGHRRLGLRDRQRLRHGHRHHRRTRGNRPDRGGRRNVSRRRRQLRGRRIECRGRRNKRGFGRRHGDGRRRSERRLGGCFCGAVSGAAFSGGGPVESGNADAELALALRCHPAGLGLVHIGFVVPSIILATAALLAEFEFVEAREVLPVRLVEPVEASHGIEHTVYLGGVGKADRNTVAAGSLLQVPGHRPVVADDHDPTWRDIQEGAAGKLFHAHREPSVAVPYVEQTARGPALVGNQHRRKTVGHVEGNFKWLHEIRHNQHRNTRFLGLSRLLITC